MVDRKTADGFRAANTASRAWTPRPRDWKGNAAVSGCGIVFAADKRSDIPFVPHITVGTHRQLGDCERVAAQLNEGPRIVRALISSVHVIDLGEPMVRTAAEIPLGLGGNRPPNHSAANRGLALLAPGR